ncbi:MAG TPA: hypothetical protein VFH68_02700 [Polyangia bacterium]|nr:hypothetical protein [Polyangia bacterium]
MLVLGGAGLASGLGILKSRKRPTRDKPSGRRAAIGAVSLMAGIILIGLPAAYPHRDPEVITATRFSSTARPILSIDAPAGWQLTHDSKTGKLTATGGKVTLRIDTAVLSDGVDGDAFIKQVVDVARAGGATVEETFNARLDGLFAFGLSMRLADLSSTFWYVPRGGPLVTVMVCQAEGQPGAPEACKSALATLKWLPPGPL